MAPAINGLRLWRKSLRLMAPVQPARGCKLHPKVPQRFFTTTRSRCADKEEEEKEEEVRDPLLEYSRRYRNPGEALSDMLGNQKLADVLSEKERRQTRGMLRQWSSAPPEAKAEYDTLEEQTYKELVNIRRPQIPRRGSFWNEEEADPDLITDEIGEDDFDEDDMLGMAHGKLEEHREHREYARITVWEMPLLARYAKTFEPPPGTHVLRFRYTTYLGEMHPSDRKVVVEFSPNDIRELDEQQRLKLKKLAGPRYNPVKDTIKMSCERFEHAAQNKRYLGDLVQQAIETAKDPTDMFEDIPLDLRHHPIVPKPKFPKGWRMTEERRRQLEAERKQAYLLDEGKRKKGQLVDGMAAIEKALEMGPDPSALIHAMGRVRDRGRPMRRPASF